MDENQDCYDFELFSMRFTANYAQGNQIQLIVSKTKQWLMWKKVNTLLHNMMFNSESEKSVTRLEIYSQQVAELEYELMLITEAAITKVLK